MRNDWLEKYLGEMTLEDSTITYGVVKPGPEGNVKFVRGGDLLNGKVLIEQLRTITQTFSNQYQRTLLKGGELLICLVGTPGQTGIVPSGLAGANIARQVGLIRLKKQYDAKFYSYYFLSPIGVEKLGLQETGSVQRVINLAALKSLKVPCPPFEEQKRIVEILDETFAAIDKAKANVEKNLQNAKELFENEKMQIFQSLGDNNSRVPLESVCDEIFAGGDAPRENFSSTRTEKFKIPIIANAVENNGLYGYTNMARVNRPSITIAARGSGTGHTEIRNEPFFPIVRLIVLIPKTDTVILEFLKYAIQDLTITRSGSAIPQLTVPMIKGYSIPLPQIIKQKEIVRKLDVLQNATRKLEINYRLKLNDLEELRKSILQKAFTRELTAKTLSIVDED